MEDLRLVRKENKEYSTIKVGNTCIGPDNLTIIAGPCCVESEEQLLTIAEVVKSVGATMLRGGAYKPRTSPYSFQGLEREGYELMAKAGIITGLATVCEAVDEKSLYEACEYVDMIQIGARNMQNYVLLKAVGNIDKPVLLKRGLSATVEEWLSAAEYIMSGGNENVVLCERGIRTFESTTRNTLDLSAVAVLKEMTHLPVIVDPSHATGYYKYVPSMAKAAVAAGSDGLIIEVHNHPEEALSDGIQSLKCDKFASLVKELDGYSFLAGRNTKASE